MTISIEVNISQGIRFIIVGLADNAVKESQQRIESALSTNGYEWPRFRVVINLAPADIRKEGTQFDLPLALGILGASRQLSADLLDKYVIVGELSLDGSVMPVKGILPMTLVARKQGYRGIIVPERNAREAAIVEGIDVIAAKNLVQVVSFLNSGGRQEPVRVALDKIFLEKINRFDMDFSDVKGQEPVKRALIIAAAGGHNLIMIGAPGAGKTMLAKRLPTIIPPLSLEEALDTTKIHSVAGKINGDHSLVTTRPFRSPHHTISDVALVGGGNHPQPGEISLAHNGVLFLDELPEFKRNVLEVMRQPLEDRQITVSRARFTVNYPANFMLVASMNPCPCGFYNHPEKACTCGSHLIRKYLSRISGPLLDRIDIHIEVVPVPFKQLTELRESEKSEVLRSRVMAARDIQERRFSGIPGMHCNAQMTPRIMKQYCALDNAGRAIVKAAMDRLGLSARAYERILKVSRTIADLDDSQYILPSHVSEAVNYRNLDREGWAG